MILITILLRRFFQCSLVFIYGKNAASKCSFNWNSSWGCLLPSTKDSLLRCYPNPCKPHLHDRSNVCTLLRLLYSECFVRLGRETPFTSSEQNLVNWSSVHFRQGTFCGCFGFYIHYALLRYTKAISPTVRQYCSLVNSSTRPAFNRQRRRRAAAVGRSRTLGFLIHFQGRNPTNEDGRNNDSDADRSRPDAFILSILLQI